MKNLLIVLFIVLTVSAVSTAESFSKKLLNAIKNLEKVPQGALSIAENQQSTIFKEPLFQEDSDRGWILNSEGKKALQNIILNLPCGWPEYGIPPLAPYTNEELIIDLKKNFIETLTTFIRLRVDGLDHMLINKLKISFVFGKKVKYSITLPKMVLTGKMETGILINLMQEYGINIRYDGEGNFELMLENITIEGSLKYKVPFIFGSVKIYDFICLVSLENVVSNIELTGTINKINKLLNRQIEEYLLRIVRNNQNQISVLIEENVVDKINEKMKGHKIWYLIGKLAGSSQPCYPPPIPWDLASDNKVL